MIQVAIGLTVGKAIYDMQKSDRINEQAEKKLMKSFNKIADAQIAQEEVEDTMNHAVLRLTNRKRAILLTSMQSFLNLYEKLVKINFTDSVGLNELKDFSLMETKNLHIQISSIKNSPKTPAITKNMVVGWLFGGGIGAVTSAIVDEAQGNLALAGIQAKQADVIVQQSKTINLSYQAISERADRMTDVLTKLNIMMVKGLQQAETIIGKNGMNKNSYSLEERQSLAVCVNLAGAVKSILDVPIIDKDGELTKKSLETICHGEKCIQELDFTIKNI